MWRTSSRTCCPPTTDPAAGPGHGPGSGLPRICREFVTRVVHDLAAALLAQHSLDRQRAPGLDAGDVVAAKPDERDPVRTAPELGPEHGQPGRAARPQPAHRPGHPCPRRASHRPVCSCGAHKPNAIGSMLTGCYLLPSSCYKEVTSRALAGLGLAGFGDLRAALERVQRPRALLMLRWLLAERPQRFVGKADLQQLAGRDRVLAADHDDGREHALQGPGEVLMRGRRAVDEAAQEPAGPVCPQEADRFQRATPTAVDWVGGGDPRPQFHPERAIGLAALTTAPGHLRRDLLPDLFPQAATLRRGEGLQLQAALAVHDGDPGRLVLHDADLYLNALSGRDQQAAEVDPLLAGKVFLHVPRTAHPGRLRAGLTGAGLWVTRAVLAGRGLRLPLAGLQPVRLAPGLA